MKYWLITSLVLSDNSFTTTTSVYTETPAQFSKRTGASIMFAMRVSKGAYDEWCKPEDEA